MDPTSVRVYYESINQGLTRLCPEQGPVEWLSLPDCNHVSLLMGLNQCQRPTRFADRRRNQQFCRGFLYEHVQCSCSQLSWEIIIGAFYLCPPILWSVYVAETPKGGSQRKMASGPLTSCHCPPCSFSLLILHFPLPPPPLPLFFFSPRAWDASRFLLL